MELTWDAAAICTAAVKLVSSAALADGRRNAHSSKSQRGGEAPFPPPLAGGALAGEGAGRTWRLSRIKGGRKQAVRAAPACSDITGTLQRLLLPSSVC